jgi:hypothetical protein
MTMPRGLGATVGARRGGKKTMQNQEDAHTAVVITGRYTGGLGVRARHELSGTELATAAPLDNRGDGSSFSPTDLMATALGTCILRRVGVRVRPPAGPYAGPHVRRGHPRPCRPGALA